MKQNEAGAQGEPHSVDAEQFWPIAAHGRQCPLQASHVCSGGHCPLSRHGTPSIFFDDEREAIVVVGGGDDGKVDSGAED